VPELLRILTAVIALAVAVWAGVATARDRAPSAAMLWSLWVIEAFSLALVGTAVARMVSGHQAPSEITFVGYLIAFLLIPPAGWALARLEPSRWGSVIILAVGIVEAILVVRLEQVWTGV